MHMKVQILSFIMNLIFLRSVFLDQVIHFGKNLGDLVKDPLPKKLKTLLEVPYVALLKIQVLSLN